MLSDIGLEVLETCERNVWNNRHLYVDSDTVRVRELNWMLESQKKGKQSQFFKCENVCSCHNKINFEVILYDGWYLKKK